MFYAGDETVRLRVVNAPELGERGAEADTRRLR